MRKHQPVHDCDQCGQEYECYEDGQCKGVCPFCMRWWALEED